MKPGRFATGVATWGFALGCIIGWGSFVMPGTTFLPDAGPVGSLLGIAIATLAVFLIAVNYYYLSREFPDGAGSYHFVKSTLDNDHAFLSVWSLALAYLSLLWANATAFVLIGRYLLGGVFQWGFQYALLGYDVYFGEVLVTIAVQVVFGLLSCYASKLADGLRTILAAGLLVSVLLLFLVCVPQAGSFAVSPPFASGEPASMQVLGIAIMAPWLFVGFEIVFQDAGYTKLTPKGVFVAAVLAIAAGFAIYAMLTLVGSSGAPGELGSWEAYASSLNGFGGVDGMPVLYNVQAALGDGGLRLAGVAVLCALSTSVLGFYRAAARVLKTMADDGLLPKRLSETKDGVPRNAILAIMLISLPIPFLGRTAVGWNADVSTLSVAIVYAYVSFCAYRKAVERKRRGFAVVGAAGLVVSILIFFFLLVPNVFLDSALATESYFMLAAWSALGVVCYWLAFRRDDSNQFGRSTAMWVAMLFLLLFSANVWARLRAQGRLEGFAGADVPLESTLMESSVIMLVVIVFALLVMHSLFSTILKRQKELDLKVVQAEERNRAKTSFLSNMSHDIRTPMNAIVGFTNLAMLSTDDGEKTREYLEKIQASSAHLLSLINDVLEMSRIESGKIKLEEQAVNLPGILRDLDTIVAGQAESKQIELSMDMVGVDDEDVWCDKLRLNQMLLNLLSNAVKYTPSGGRVSVLLAQNGRPRDGWGSYEIRVKDNGIGMAPEFAERVFEAFEREKTSTVDGIQGTGLGMAITKKIVDLMGGTIEVETAPGLGSEFIVNVDMRVQDKRSAGDGVGELRGQSGGEQHENGELCAGKRLLLVDDIELNREIAVAILEMHDFVIEEAGDGKEAVEMVSRSEPGYYDAVLMDIQMPVMNGYEATRAIRKLDDPGLSSVPIIAVTANAFEEDRIAALDAGMDGHIAKPIEADELIKALGTTLKSCSMINQR